MNARKLLIPAILLVIAGALSTQSFQPTQAADSPSVFATYSQGVLHVNLPYQAHAGTGQLTLEVLDPEDQVLAHTEHRVDLTGANGTWQEDLKLTKALPAEDLVWNRLRYRVAYTDPKAEPLQVTQAISEILRTPIIRILGQQSYLTGGPAAVRVVVADSSSQPIAGPSTLRIELTAPNQPARPLFTGRVNARGTTEAQFRFPPSLAGSYSLHYVVDTPIGSTEFNQAIRLEDRAAILLTTEKPIYQPGQTIHVRALALDPSSHQAAANRNLTFEVEDSRGNKVFKKSVQTDKFGIASAEFALADEVNLGTYHLRALMADAQGGAAKASELALNVERYVLPKFKVAVEFAGKDQPARHGYRPGDHVTGTVRANYFFGKPVDGAEITVKASAMDVALVDAGSTKGKTDADGAYHFDLQLPNYFAGHPLNHEAARVLIEATVKDSAGHPETRGEPITVSDSPLLITAIPEGGTLIPGLDNQVFILTSYPDGKPAPATLRTRFAGSPDQTIATDAGGVAVINVKAGANGATASLTIEASDKEGNRDSKAVPLPVRPGRDQILLRTERAVYRAGERIELKVLSNKRQGTAYIDIIKEGQTVLTRDLDIVNGQAELSLTATGDLAGTLDCNAYLFGQDAGPIADHRLLFVQPADELKIEATADAAVYKPGDDARVRFRVTNSKGEGVQAALGLQVVDEAVFALAEKQPGFAKVFFYLEQEALKPRYEIHSIGMPDIVEPVPLARADQHDRAARALFAATEMVHTNKFETELGRHLQAAKLGEYYSRYRTQFTASLNRISEPLIRAYTENHGDLTKASSPRLYDAWDTALRIERAAGGQDRYFILRSAGPDKRFGTNDDLSTYIEVRTGQSVGHPISGAVDVHIEHDRGPMNGLAEIAGSVKDQTGVAIPGATVNATETATGKVRTVGTNPQGQFSLAGLPAGKYQVQVTSTGFRLATQSVILNARDRAVLSAVLTVGMVTEAFTVQAAAPPLVPRPAMRAFDAAMGGGGGRGGAGGGVIGGIAGGVPRGDFVVVTGANALLSQQGQQGQQAQNMAFKVGGALKKEFGEAPAAHVRSYFPEALYINPEIITDQHGLASISIPLADSITTWRMAMMASTARGALGSGTSSLKVFQDFFVDLDLPVTLTQGDRVSIPVAAYNYSGANASVALQLQPADWFTLVQDVGDKTVPVESGRVGGSQFTIEAKRIGKFKLTLSARMTGGARRADIVVREIEVIPNGREQTQVFNGRLESSVQHTLNFPAATVPESSTVFVRLYPGPLSQVVEGMDAILRMPGGCFEQTSSSTYPNVLALDYMKRTKKLTPEVHAKAEGFIANGYQRLLTFEIPNGGFSWFGSAPANKILTAYGLMEFSDMSKVHDVDPKLIQRTQQWLAAQQQPDGSWKPDTNFINEGATNRYNSDLLRITAYLGWSLQNTGYQGAAVEKARQYVQAHMNGKPDAYTLAVVANFAADYARDRAFTQQAIQMLLDARTEKDEQAWWNSEETGVFATGVSAAVETTGLAVQALLKSGEASATASKALHYIAAKKDASGTWGNTQATIMALRALLLSTSKGAADVRGTVEVTFNGKPVQKLTLTPENNDLLHQFVLKPTDAAAPNSIAIRFDGKGGLAYQVVGRYFVPWTEKPAGEALSISVNYDRTSLVQNDIATATATVRNNLPKSANMVMVDLGIPPGFDLLSEDLQTFVEQSAGRKSGRLEKFSLTATQAILYFDSLAAGDTVNVRYRLRAKYPIRARTIQSRVYEYYSPDINAVARPIQLEVGQPKKR